MRRLGIALVASVALAGCVQTRQYADVEFTPPQGDYKLLVMRPDVTVGSVTTGGLVEPRADWTETARAKLLAALRAQQAGRGGNVLILDRRVPILFWRRGMAPTNRNDSIETADIMPTLAASMGLSVDASRIDGHCLSIQTISCPAR